MLSQDEKKDLTSILNLSEAALKTGTLPFITLGQIRNLAARTLQEE